TGNKMISWQQLKLLRKESSKGRPAGWFKIIEEMMLENRSNRQLKPEYMIPNENKKALQASLDSCSRDNKKALQASLDSCSRDNRKREWIVLKSPKGKEVTSLTIRKVVTYTPKKVFTEH